MSKFNEKFVERVRITTRQEFIEKAKEAFMFGVTEMDALTILADDAREAGMSWEEFSDILIEGGYAPWVARRRAHEEGFEPCETTAD